MQHPVLFGHHTWVYSPSPDDNQSVIQIRWKSYQVGVFDHDPRFIAWAAHSFSDTTLKYLVLKDPFQSHWGMARRGHNCWYRSLIAHPLLQRAPLGSKGRSVYVYQVRPDDERSCPSLENLD